MKKLEKHRCNPTARTKRDNIVPIKKGGEAATSTLNPEPNESKVKRTNPRSDGEPYLSCLSYHSHPVRPCVRPCGAPSPRGEGCDTRIPSSKKAAHHPCEPIRSPSTVILSAAEGSILHCRHMHTCTLTQTTPWCFLFRLSLAHDLPVCRKDPSTSVGMTFKGNG